MNKIIYTFLALCPSFIHVRIRKMMGQKIGKKVKLKIGTLIYATEIEIGSYSIIGPFTFIKAEKFKVGENSTIKSLVIIKTLKVQISNYVHIAPICIINSEFTVNSILQIGDHSRIFPFCWLDTGEGINIGENVGIGGHTLMFTHGVWSNFIEGGPIDFGSITIKNNVWLPWRIFILPNVTIGENAIVGANSLINKDVEDNSLVAGSPAKLIKKMVYDTTKRKERFIKILEEYSKYIEFKLGIGSKIERNQLIFENSKIVIDETENLNQGDMLILLNKNFNEVKSLLNKGLSILNYKQKIVYVNGNRHNEIVLFITYLRRFGVRLYIDKKKK